MSSRQIWGYRALLVLLLLASCALRLELAHKGGQFYFADEIRYQEAQRALALLQEGRVREALSPATMSVEHIGYKLLCVGVEAARLKLGAGYGFSGMVFGLFSTCNILLVWAAARRAGSRVGEAFLAALLAACATSMVIYSRHLVPYDAALAFGLGALALAASDRLGRWGLAACGALCAACFLTYNGYWLMTPLVALVIVVRGKWSFRDVLWRWWPALAGALAVMALIMATGRTPASAMQEYKAFAGTILMGDTSEGHLFPLEYFWLTEGPLALLWLAAALCLPFARKTPERSRGLLWLGCALAGYALLAVCSSVLHVFVVYGRTARVLAPFCSLAAAAWLSALPWERLRWRKVVASTAVLTLLAVAALNMLPLWRMVFMEDFVVMVSGPYAQFRNRPSFDITHTGSPLPEHLRQPVAVVLDAPSPLSYLPFRYEGFNHETRDMLASQPQRFLFVKTRFDLPATDIDILGERTPPDIYTIGMGDIGEQQGMRTAWSMGPETALQFWEHGGRSVRLDVALANLMLPKQAVTVLFNGATVWQQELPEGKLPVAQREASLVLPTRDGLNTLEFRYEDWNTRTQDYVPTDRRPFAAVFTRLRIATEPAGAK